MQSESGTFTSVKHHSLHIVHQMDSARNSSKLSDGGCLNTFYFEIITHIKLKSNRLLKVLVCLTSLDEHKEKKTFSRWKWRRTEKIEQMRQWVKKPATSKYYSTHELICNQQNRKNTNRCCDSNKSRFSKLIKWILMAGITRRHL